MAIVVRQARRDGDLGRVGALWGEYLRWANERFDAEYGFRLDVEEVLERNLEDLSAFQPPDGRLLLAVDGTAAVGVGCLQKLRPDTAEVKRMFVRPSARGRGVGKLLLDRLVEAARQTGYDQVVLDSTRFMHAAHSLYRSVGFRTIEPYPESEIPVELRHHWLFMGCISTRTDRCADSLVRALPRTEASYALPTRHSEAAVTAGACLGSSRRA